MRFFFRTDADTTIGTGHLMRCLALAEALSEGGAECVFLCRGKGLGPLKERIVTAGHQLLSLPESVASPDADGPPHAPWLPGGQSNDVAGCLTALVGIEPVDWLVVDHYALDRRWQSAMRVVASRIMVIDDLADRAHDCDLLLDQSLIDGMQTRYDSLVPKNCLRLLGPRYAILRKEFVREHAMANQPSIENEVPRLLIMFGGVDTQNLTLRAVDCLIRLAWPGDIDIVVGALYGNLVQLEEAVSHLAAGHLHSVANNVAALMRGADLALGSPGIASWERCACAVPSITIAQADNQEGIGRALGEAGASLYLGRAESVADTDLRAALRILLANASARKAMSRSAAMICDGDGLRRVVARLLPTPLSIVPVLPDHAELLFSWRNDERTRRYSLDSRPLVLAEHYAWLKRTLASPDVDLLMAYCGEKPVACIRFDSLGTRARVSIYTNPDLQRSGYGEPALLAALQWLRLQRPEVVATDADVMFGNVGSQSLFSAAGYQMKWYRFERNQSEAETL